MPGERPALPQTPVMVARTGLNKPGSRLSLVKFHGANETVIRAAPQGLRRGGVVRSDYTRARSGRDHLERFEYRPREPSCKGWLSYWRPRGNQLRWTRRGRHATRFGRGPIPVMRMRAGGTIRGVGHFPIASRVDRRDVLILLVAALVAAATTWLAVSPPSDFATVSGADLPRHDPVGSWSAASQIAGVPLFSPSLQLGTSRISARGVPGDASRPIVATYANGVQVIEAERGVLPGPELGEQVSLVGADEAWRGEVAGVTYLYVRRGSTLVILSGGPDAELMAIARSLRPVTG